MSVPDLILGNERQDHGLMETLTSGRREVHRHALLPGLHFQDSIPSMWPGSNADGVSLVDGTDSGLGWEGGRDILRMTGWLHPISQI